MTENEAKSYMEDEIRCIQRAPYCDRNCAKCDLVKEEEPLLEAFGEAVKALEEIQQYRAIGTVEEIKSFFNENRKAGYKHGHADGYAKAIDEITEKFRVGYEEMKNIDMEDCINWADWLVVEAEMMKGGAE